ncbi:NifU family protein [Brevundimonas halotolerans]|nr:NifU family protein [Brevundimonas halotolerans]
MFIQTETTPNPRALKFLPGREVSPDRTLEFRTIDEATASPLAEALFELENVVGVMLGADHIAVTRGPDGPDWSDMKAPILAAIMDHFVSGRPVVNDGVSAGEASDGAEDTEIVQEIKALLDSRIRPAVAQDGGDILFDSFDEASGLLTLRMRGACAGCPSSTATLKAGVEQMMRHYIPEVTQVEQTL